MHINSEFIVSIRIGFSLAFSTFPQKMSQNLKKSPHSFGQQWIARFNPFTKQNISFSLSAQQKSYEIWLHFQFTWSHRMNQHTMFLCFYCQQKCTKNLFIFFVVCTLSRKNALDCAANHIQLTKRNNLTIDYRFRRATQSTFLNRCEWY